MIHSTVYNTTVMMMVLLFSLCCCNKVAAQEKRNSDSVSITTKKEEYGKVADAIMKGYRRGAIDAIKEAIQILNSKNKKGLTESDAKKCIRLAGQYEKKMYREIDEEDEKLRRAISGGGAIGYLSGYSDGVKTYIMYPVLYPVFPLPKNFDIYYDSFLKLAEDNIKKFKEDYERRKAADEE